MFWRSSRSCWPACRSRSQDWRFYTRGDPSAPRKTDDPELQLHAYILANPEVIRESMKGLEARRQAAAEAAKVVSARRSEHLQRFGLLGSALPRRCAAFVHERHCLRPLACSSSQCKVRKHPVFCRWLFDSERPQRVDLSGSDRPAVG
ncbi:hypothetical protein [Sinorhizobium meliloti]|uniref:hypothetical protein n=1 Tax=Rhizobium meliloti TaxID=382 RepID=UPI0013E2F9EB